MMIIFLFGLSFFITLISIFILLYLSIGITFPEANLQFEIKLRKYLHKPSVIVIDSASHIRKRNVKYLRCFLVVIIITKLTIYMLFRRLTGG